MQNDDPFQSVNISKKHTFGQKEFPILQSQKK